jgi:diadenylate cyclase
LSQKKLGGLIAIECEIGFRGVQETGVLLDAKVSVELLLAIFQKNSPLHDGGVVLRGDRVVAAGCVFPLTQRGGLSAELGMRHRAGIGLSEETDAIVIMVSEETGMVSVAHHGHFHRDFDPLRLRQYLAGTLAPPARSHWLVDNLRRLLATLLPVRGAAREEAAVAGKPEVRE